MELIVVFTSLLRLLLVGIVYALNASALVKIVSNSAATGACVHVLTSAAVLLAGLLYLSSWAPYLVYSLTDGKWLLLGANRHCLLQHFVTSEISAVLLALLAVRVLYRYLVRVLRRPAPTARAASLATCLAWLGPQLLYDAMTASMDGLQDSGTTESTYRFLDDVMEIPRKNLNSTRGYRVGFMVCLQTLDSSVLSSFVWQYAVVVLPLGALVVFCGFRLLLGPKTNSIKDETLVNDAKPMPIVSTSGEIIFTEISGFNASNPCIKSTLWSTGNDCNQHYQQQQECSRSCSRDTLVDMALYYNLIWLLLLRPLAVLHALYLQSGSSHGNVGTGASYIDIGSHLVLTFSCVFSPFSPRVGLCGRTTLKKTETPELLELHHHQLLLDIPNELVISPKTSKIGHQTQEQTPNKAAILESSGESFC